MKISEALDFVSKIYQPGMTSFFGNSKEDLWQKAHDDFEGKIILYGAQTSEAESAAKEFTSRCKKLAGMFESMRPEKAKLTLVDAYLIGNVERVRRIQSIENRQCFRCDSKREVRIVSLGDDSVLMCLECVKSKEI